MGLIALVFFALASVYYTVTYFVVGQVTFPLDDAFIHLQFARHLAESGEMSFNAGTPSSGCTAPGFAWLLSLALRWIDEWRWASFSLTSLFSLLTAAVVYQILMQWTSRRTAALGGGLLAVVASPAVIQAFAGMEAPVYACLCMIGVWWYGSSRLALRLFATVMLALCTWMRPEFLAVAPLLGLEILLRPAGRWRDGRWIELAFAVIVWLGTFATYVYFHRQLDGHNVPSTFDAKAVAHFALKPHWLEGVPAVIEHGNWRFLPLALVVWPIVNLLLIGVGLATVCLPLSLGLRANAKALWRDMGRALPGRRLALLLLVGFPLLRAFVDPLGMLWFQGQRYFAHLTPLLIVVAVGAFPLTGSLTAGGKWDWSRWSLTKQLRRATAWALVGAVGFGALAVLSVKNIADMHLAAAKWIRANSEPDDVIATNDIGALGFLGERRILDTVGLVEPEIVDHYLAGGTLLQYLREHRPRWVAIFPEWYPDAAESDELTRVTSFVADPNVVCGGDELVIFAFEAAGEATDAAP